VLTLFQRGDPVVVRRVQQRPLAELGVAIISVEEALTAWYARLRRARKRDQLPAVYQRLTETVRLLARLPILTFSEAARTRYEELRARYRRLGRNELRIAGIALEADAAVATRNVRDFGQLEGLRVDAWSE
jgi:tRNA(fMet)-specific endonuclease VapC